jgi:exodeoxyribonuclease VII large subunit
MKIYSVSEINTEARQAMLLAFEYPINVKGEISDYRQSRGHQYFKLRDMNGNYTVSCVMWKGSYGNIDISQYLDREVIVTAKVDFYAGFGQFQLNIIELSEFGDGFLKNEIEKIKKKLSDEGVFSKKRSLPKYPKKIAILTAKDSHALKDVCSKLNEKYCMAEILVYPSTVQGPLAPKNLIKQLKRINQDSLADIILIVRGGGTLQDLMAFNDESLVREISQSNIPTITGIGHKPDITLADYASDSAQETPTAAAVHAVPDSQMLKQDIIHYENSIIKLMNNIILKIENKIKGNYLIIKMTNPFKTIESLSKDFIQRKKILKKTIQDKILNNQDYLKDERTRQSHILRKTAYTLTEYIKTVDKTYKDIKKLVKIRVHLNDDILFSKKQQVKQMNPALLLKKGYAIVRNSNKDIIKSIKGIPNKSELSIQVSDGIIKVNRKE